MKKLLGFLILLCGAATLAHSRPAVAVYRGVEVVADEVLVAFDESMHPADILRSINAEGLHVARIRLDNGTSVSEAEFVGRASALRPVRTFVLRFDPRFQAMSDVLARLRTNPDVLSAGPNFVVWANFTPNDPRYSSQWGLPKIGAPAAWDRTKGSSNILVAVTDTGVDYNHEDAPVNYRTDIDYDFINNDADAMDDQGHGTHVAGTIAEATNNSVGAAGIAPDVSVIGVKVLGADGSGSFDQVAAGIDWARTHGANVVNLSLGASQAACSDPEEPGACETVEAAVTAAWNAGVFLACATGNDNGPVGVPASFSGCTAVGSTTSSDTRSSFSNYGPEIDIVAPGSGIMSMYKGSYASLSGTSMATPHIAGAAALVFSASSTTTASTVRSKLISTARDLGSSGFDNYYGNGLVQVDKALN